MKLSTDFRKLNVWVPTLIFGASLAALIIYEDQITKDPYLIFINMVLSIITLIAFMFNVWLPVLFVGVIGSVLIISDHEHSRNVWSYSTAIYKEDSIHIDTSVFILTLFAFIVFSYMYRLLEKRLPRVLKFLLAIIIIIVGLFILPSNIETLLKNIF